MLDLARLAQGTRTAAAFESQVFSWLQGKVGFDAASFMVPGAEQTPTLVGLGQEAAELLVVHSHIYEQELLPVRRAALAANGVAVDTRVRGESLVRKCRYHREIAAPVGGRHSLLAYLTWSGRVFGLLMLGRTQRTFAAEEVQFMESILPDLSVARAAYGLPWAPKPLPGSTTNGVKRWLGLDDSRPLASVPGAWGTLSVRDRAGFREMLASKGQASLVWTRCSLRDPRDSGWPYVELLHIACVVAARRRNALFIGCGGAVSLQQFASTYPGIRLDLVESEVAVVELARKWFGLVDIPNLKLHIGDGAEFIRSAHNSTWDVVVIDAFDASHSCIEFFADDFLRTLHGRLSPGGAVSWNVISSLQSGVASKLVAAAQRVFDVVRLVPVVVPGEDCSADTLRNIVVVAKRTE